MLFCYWIQLIIQEEKETLGHWQCITQNNLRSTIYAKKKIMSFEGMQGREGKSLMIEVTKLSEYKGYDFYIPS